MSKESQAADGRGPTESHVISRETQHEENRTVPSVGDAVGGWSGTSVQEIIPGIPNEHLWMLIRRFNKQVYSVRAIPEAPMHSLDVTRAEQEQFSPDKLRAALERFYLEIVLSLASLVNHIARLRSWKEPRRTFAFCTAYFVSWLVDLLMPTFFAIVAVLALYPPSRKRLFPPAPVALVDSNTGGVQKPKAGVLGSHDSITGVPERVKGEASEQEASNLMKSLGSLAAGSVVGKHDQGVPDNAPIESSVPDAMDITSEAAEAQSAARGDVPTESHDKSRPLMSAAVTDGADQAMRIIGDIIDNYECFGNALSPTPPFSSATPRVRMGAVLGATLFLALATSSYAFTKAVTFGIGLCLFGNPIVQRAIEHLNRKYPGWMKMLKPQNFLLKGIPTNAQLTLTLLRIGEANAAPLPPLQLGLHEKAPSQPASPRSSQVNLAASKEEIDQAVSPDTPPHQRAEIEETKKPKSWILRIIGSFRTTTAAGIESKMASDRVRAVAGSKRAKERVGVLNRKDHLVSPAGPTEFAARYKGKRGAVVIDSSEDPQLLFFTTDPSSVRDGQRLKSIPSGAVSFRVPVTDIQEITKIGGLGWKGKLVTGWAVKSKEVVDGLVLICKNREVYQIMAMPMRDELFNRLLAINGQIWESC